MNNTHLSSRVGRLNPDWTDPDQSPEKENAAFQQAVMLAGGEFMEVFDRCPCTVDSLHKNFVVRLCVCYLSFYMTILSTFTARAFASMLNLGYLQDLLSWSVCYQEEMLIQVEKSWFWIDSAR